MIRIDIQVIMWKYSSQAIFKYHEWAFPAFHIRSLSTIVMVYLHSSIETNNADHYYYYP